MIIKPKMKQYAFWDPEGFWMTYDTLEDAVTEAGDQEIYELVAKPIGYYTMEVKRLVTLRKKRRHKSKEAGE